MLSNVLARSRHGVEVRVVDARELQIPRGGAFVQIHQATRFGERERAQEQSVHDREHCRVGRDAERERQDDEGSGPGLSTEGPEGEPQVGKERAHRGILVATTATPSPVFVGRSAQDVPHLLR
jgi:hypothetical protein